MGGGVKHTSQQKILSPRQSLLKTTKYGDAPGDGRSVLQPVTCFSRELKKFISLRRNQMLVGGDHGLPCTQCLPYPIARRSHAADQFDNDVYIAAQDLVEIVRPTHVAWYPGNPFPVHIAVANMSETKRKRRTAT